LTERYRRVMIVHGSGTVNTLINKLPVELHLPGYQYCGPGTKLKKRLARGDPGINPPDAACKEHDVAYSENRDNLEVRHAADKVLASKAWSRVTSKDTTAGERAAALVVTGIMKTKTQRKSQKKGGGIAFGKIVKSAKKSMIKSRDAKRVIASALKGARKAVKKCGGTKKVNKLRVLPLPIKTGEILLLIPIFADLSVLGALAGGAAGVAMADNCGIRRRL